MRRGGAKSFVDDLVFGRGVVLSRAATSLRSIETQPWTRRFVCFSGQTHLLLKRLFKGRLPTRYCATTTTTGPPSWPPALTRAGGRVSKATSFEPGWWPLGLGHRLGKLVVERWWPGGRRVGRSLKKRGIWVSNLWSRLCVFFFAERAISHVGRLAHFGGPVAATGRRIGQR